MRKAIIILTFVISIFYLNAAEAQDELKNIGAKATKKDTRTFSILSLNGKNKKLIIMPDYVNKVLRIICLKDTISVNDLECADGIYLLDSKFK